MNEFNTELAGRSSAFIVRVWRCEQRERETDWRDGDAVCRGDGWCSIAWSYLDGDEEILKDKLHFFFRCIARSESGVGNSSRGPC